MRLRWCWDRERADWRIGVTRKRGLPMGDVAVGGRLGPLIVLWTRKGRR